MNKYWYFFYKFIYHNINSSSFTAYFWKFVIF